MPRLENFKELQKRLQRMRAESKTEDNTSVTVGFSQNYAVWVHEVRANHKDGKQWHYLSTPARQLESELGQIILTAYKTTGNMLKSLLVAGMRLQREAQQIVPIDTAALKASAFTAPTAREDEAAAKAYVKSEFRRARTMDQRAEKAANKAAKK